MLCDSKIYRQIWLVTIAVTLIHNVEDKVADLCGGLGEDVVTASIGEGCIFILPVTYTWPTAGQICQIHHPDARLLSIETASKQNRVIQALGGLKLESEKLWIGGFRRLARWHWVSDKTPLTDYVGCCRIFSNDRVPYSKTIFDNSADKCSQTCRDRGYRNSYIKHRSCVCGNNLCIEYRADAECTKSCPGNLKDTCGNRAVPLYSEYNVTDDVPRWISRAPVQVFETSPGKACGALEIQTVGSDTEIRLTDKSCLHGAKSICQYHRDSREKCDDRLSINLCLRITETLYSWYKAREICRADGGDLAKIKGENSVIPSALKAFSRYWIGLWRLEERWASGKDIIFRSSTLSLGCVLVVLDSGTLRWKGDNCSISRKFICEKRRSYPSSVHHPQVVIASGINTTYKTIPKRIISEYRTTVTVLDHMRGERVREPEVQKIDIEKPHRSAVSVPALVAEVGVPVVLLSVVGVAFCWRRYHPRQNPPIPNQDDNPCDASNFL